MIADTPIDSFTQSLLSTKGLLPSDDLADWAPAMVDALILDTIKEALACGKDPRDFIVFLMQLFQERAADWIATMPPR